MKTMYKHIYQGMTVLILLSILLLGFPTTVLAFEFDEDGSLPAEVTIEDDYFIAGDKVVVDGTVNGDLFAAGEMITINGNVKGSLIAAAQTIIINGQVDGSIYGASYSMQFGETASVGRNLYYAGFSFEAKPGSIVTQDLAVAGYQAVLAGEVGRDILGALGALEISGNVGRNVKVEIGEAESEVEVMPPFFSPPTSPAMISPGLRIAEEAVINGKLTYTSPTNQSSSIQAKPEGGVIYQTPQPETKETTPIKHEDNVALKVGGWFLKRIQELVTLIVLGGIAIWLAPNALNRWSNQAKSTPVPAAGWGLLSIVLGYTGAGLLALTILAVAIFLGVLTLGGLGGTVFGVGFSALSLAFTLFNLFVSYGSKLIIALVVGRLLLERFASNYAEHKVWPLILGVLIYVLLRSIPILGWVIGLLVTLVGVGAIWMVFQLDRKSAPIETAGA